MAWGSAYFVISLNPEFPPLFVENGIPYSDALVGTFSVLVLVHKLLYLSVIRWNLVRRISKIEGQILVHHGYTLKEYTCLQHFMISLFTISCRLISPIKIRPSTLVQFKGNIG
jgi:hypothetical protein